MIYPPFAPWPLYRRLWRAARRVGAWALRYEHLWLAAAVALALAVSAVVAWTIAG